MENRTVRLAKPLYELLPYLYISVGLLGFLGAYLWAGRFWSDVALVLGVACVVGGVVLLLRRKDYRERQARYTGGSLIGSDVDEEDKN